MILSMTGFGRSTLEYSKKKITIDLKSLNSKTLDLNLKIPICYKEKEFDLRKLISKHLIRGKIDCYINIENLDDKRNSQINKSILSFYMQDLMQISDSINEIDAMKMAIRLPDILINKDEEIDEEEWKILSQTMLNSLKQINDFRKIEGEILEQELKNNIKQIENNLNIIPNFEKERIERIKQKFEDNLGDLQINIDENRLHQELIFYVEKFDISEEKIRLKQHINYFLETIKQLESGKKLGFIAQEIGREINTIGSKANHHEIQKIVVLMKDDLEKIKEQLFNVL